MWGDFFGPRARCIFNVGLKCRTATWQQTANDHILCWMTKHESGSALIALRWRYANALLWENDRNEHIFTIHCDFLRSFGKTASEGSSSAKMSEEFRRTRPRACEFKHFSLHPTPLHFVQRHYLVCSVVWLRAPQGSARWKRMCLLQHFYAIYNVQSTVLIAPSRPIEIGACALSNPPGVN